MTDTPFPTPYTPSPRRYRHDGWTPERQTAFLHALAASACVTEAAKAVGMSTQSAYRLRADPHAVYFRAAWEQCLDMGMDRLADAALGRAMHGVAQPIFYRGEQVGERRRYDEKLAMFLLRYRRPERYGAALDRTVATSRPDAAARRLDICLRAIEGEEWDAILADGDRPARPTTPSPGSNRPNPTPRRPKRNPPPKPPPPLKPPRTTKRRIPISTTIWRSTPAPNA